jgi:hypothetical protein
MIVYNTDTKKKEGQSDGDIKITGTGILSRANVDEIMKDYKTYSNVPLKLVMIGSGITQIESMAGLTFGTIVFSPDSKITSLPANCFNKVSADTVYLPALLQNIPDGCFTGSQNLIRTWIPSPVRSIGFAAYSGCKALSEITIPPNVKSISDNVFSSCSRLQKITFSPKSSLTNVGEYAFTGTALQHLHLPLTVKEVGGFAFENIPTLRSLAVRRSLWPAISQQLKNGVPRFIYFYDGKVYQNQNSDKNDLVDDVNGLGAEFFTIEKVPIPFPGLADKYDDSDEITDAELKALEAVRVEEERVAEAQRDERARVAETERIQRQLAAWQKQKEINDLQALADAALTEVDIRTRQDAVDVLIVKQVTQTLIDSTLDAQDKVVADQDVRDQIIADQVQSVTNVNLKAPNESYSIVQESPWPPGLIAGVVVIVLILVISYASILKSNWSFFVGSRKR